MPPMTDSVTPTAHPLLASNRLGRIDTSKNGRICHNHAFCGMRDTNSGRRSLSSGHTRSVDVFGCAVDAIEPTSGFISHDDPNTIDARNLLQDSGVISARNSLTARQSDR